MNENNIIRPDSAVGEKDAVEIDLLEVLNLLKNKILYIVAVALVFATVAAVYFSYFVSPTYTTRARIYIDGDYAESQAGLAISLATNIAKDYPYIINSSRVLDQVSENLELGVPGSSLMGAINVAIPGEEVIRVIDVYVNYNDPQQAADIANEMIAVFSKELPNFAQYSKITVRVIDPAQPPKAPSSQNVLRNTLIAAFLGAVLTAVVFVVINTLDDKIKSEMDIEKYLGLNVLCAIPDYRETPAQRKQRLKAMKKSKQKNAKEATENE